MRHPHKWEELLPEEFMEEFHRAPIVYWGSGGMEDHGLHNALGVDPYIANELCLRAASLAGDIVFPPVPFAPADIPGLSRQQLRSGQHFLFPPSLWVSRELCEHLYIELLESLADFGFKVCLAVGWHYPGALLLKELYERADGKIKSMSFWGGPVQVPELQPDPLADGHGLMWESSLLIAVREDWVDISRAPAIRTSPIISQVQAASPEAIDYVKYTNRSLGNQWLDAAAQHLATKARTLLARALSESLEV